MCLTRRRCFALLCGWEEYRVQRRGRRSSEVELRRGEIRITLVCLPGRFIPRRIRRWQRTRPCLGRAPVRGRADPEGPDVVGGASLSGGVSDPCSMGGAPLVVRPVRARAPAVGGEPGPAVRDAGLPRYRPGEVSDWRGTGLARCRIGEAPLWFDRRGGPGVAGRGRGRICFVSGGAHEAKGVGRPDRASRLDLNIMFYSVLWISAPEGIV